MRQGHVCRCVGQWRLWKVLLAQLPEFQKAERSCPEKRRWLAKAAAVEVYFCSGMSGYSLWPDDHHQRSIQGGDTSGPRSPFGTLRGRGAGGTRCGWQPRSVDLHAQVLAQTVDRRRTLILAVLACGFLSENTPMLMVPDALISSRVRYTTLLPDAALPDAALPEAAVEEEPPHAVRSRSQQEGTTRNFGLFHDRLLLYNHFPSAAPDQAYDRLILQHQT